MPSTSRWATHHQNSPRVRVVVGGVPEERVRGREGVGPDDDPRRVAVHERAVAVRLHRQGARRRGDERHGPEDGGDAHRLLDGRRPPDVPGVTLQGPDLRVEVGELERIRARLHRLDRHELLDALPEAHHPILGRAGFGPEASHTARIAASEAVMARSSCARTAWYVPVSRSCLRAVQVRSSVTASASA